MIAAMEANHLNLTNQKTLYVEISRARDRAELVTDDRAALRERLESVTGERIAALDAVEAERTKGLDRARVERPGWMRTGARVGRRPGGIAGAGTDAGTQPDRSEHDAVGSITPRIRRSCEPPMRRPERADSYESPGSHAGLADPIPRERDFCVSYSASLAGRGERGIRNSGDSTNSSTMPRAFSKAPTCVIAMRTGTRHDTDSERLAA